MDRPNWSALESMFSDLKRASAGLPDMQRRMLQVTGVGWSGDRTVKAVVGPRGHLLELEIDPRVYRKPNSRELAATIVATVRVAIEDATRQTQEILDETLPADLRPGRIGELDFGRLTRSHDADIRTQRGNDDE